MTKEQNYCVYRHTCPNGKFYIGVTCNIKRRWNPSEYKNSTSFYDAIIEFGWNNITHEVLFENLTRTQALKIEDSLIKEGLKTDSCLNIRRSGHYTKTEDFKEEMRTRAKSHYKTHPEECKARSKAYRESHTEECKAQQKAWREANPDYGNTYYEEHKDKIKAYREEHKEELKAYHKAWYEAHKEEQKAYREAHREEKNAYLREWRKRNKGKGDNK